MKLIAFVKKALVWSIGVGVYLMMSVGALCLYFWVIENYLECKFMKKLCDVIC